MARFIKDQKVTIAGLFKQDLIDELGLTENLDTYGVYVSFRSRNRYVKPRDGWELKGEIVREVTNELDERFANTGSWYTVNLNYSLACYTWVNFHESEIAEIPHPLLDWMERKTDFLS